jgi:hypothetical protein
MAAAMGGAGGIINAFRYGRAYNININGYTILIIRGEGDVRNGLTSDQVQGKLDEIFGARVSRLARNMTEYSINSYIDGVKYSAPIYYNNFTLAIPKMEDLTEAQKKVLEGLKFEHYGIQPGGARRRSYRRSRKAPRRHRKTRRQH